MSLAVQRVRSFATHFEIAEDGPDVHDTWLGLLQQVSVTGKQVHDANIVATMLVHGVARLLTFNGADFRRFDRLIELIAP